VLTANSSATADDAVTWTRALVSDLRIPPLRTYGIRKTHLPEIAEKAAKASSMKANPIVLTREELVEILQRAR
jgi:alcohol dehydrogenase class IV